MKKVVLFLGLISIGLFVNAQIVNEMTLLKELGRIGIPTEVKDTLYLIDCPMSHGIVESWSEISVEQLKEDGIEKPPVFVMVSTIQEFNSIMKRILYCGEDKGLTYKKLYQ